MKLSFAAELYPDITYVKYHIFIDFYAAAIPFYFSNISRVADAGTYKLNIEEID